MIAHPPVLTPEQQKAAEEVLTRAPFAFLAMVEGGRPYAVPLNFTYEQPRVEHQAGLAGAAHAPSWGRLLFHTGPGRKTAALAGDPRVCVAVTADESFVQGATPCADGYAFRSVLAEGSARLLTELGERVEALRAIVAKYDPGASERPLDPRVLAKTLVYEVTIETLGYRER